MIRFRIAMMIFLWTGLVLSTQAQSTDPLQVERLSSLTPVSPTLLAFPQLRTSWYGLRFSGHKMANGRRFNPNANWAARKNFPLETKFVWRNPRTPSREIVVEKPDGGPYVKGRALVVS